MLIVFDLDFTLWDAGGTWCDHTTPPFRRVNGHIQDGEHREIVLYPEVCDILQHLRNGGIGMAVASRTHSPGVARELLNLFGIEEYFLFLEIYPGSKVRHFDQLQSKSGKSYNEMYFFDDEYRNIVEVGNLGVNARHVAEGLHWNALDHIPL